MNKEYITENIKLFQGDCRDVIKSINLNMEEVVFVTDPPFNINYKYKNYKDNLEEKEYYSMLKSLFFGRKHVLIHYPEQLHKHSINMGIAPTRVVSWIYNSNTRRQHRDIAFYGIAPDFSKVTQPYKNPNDKRIQKRIEAGMLGAKLYDWWNINQVKNVSKEKTEHPNQMPLEVMRNIIKIIPDNLTIVDPFMGSGTTGVICVELGKKFIGIDIDETAFNISKERITFELNKPKVKNLI